jgi:hypothetical protein
MREILESKWASDGNDNFRGLCRDPLPEHVLSFFLQRVGSDGNTAPLADFAVCELISAVERYWRENAHVGIFARLLTEEWSQNTLSFFLAYRHEVRAERGELRRVCIPDGLRHRAVSPRFEGDWAKWTREKLPTRPSRQILSLR